MTISSIESKNQYVASGGTGFDFTFRVQDPSHLAVFTLDPSAGIETRHLYPTDFTVSGTGEAAGGRVHFPVAPTPGHLVTIIRDVPFTQEVDLVENDPFSAEVLEGALDKNVMALQQMNEVVGRSFRMSPGAAAVSLEMPVPVPNSAIGWKGDGSGLINLTDLSGAPISAFMVPFLEVATAASAREYLEVAGGTTSSEGLVELATEAETSAGTDASRAVTPAGLAARLALFPVIPVFQCRLGLSGTDLMLSGWSGRNLFINGVLESIPEAGVTLAPDGLSVDSTYYIYTFMSDGTMTLEASGTAPATDATYGHLIKAGDAERTLVGLARVITGPSFADSATQRLVLSYYHRRLLPFSIDPPAGGTTTSVSEVEFNSSYRCEFLTWSGEGVRVEASGEHTHSANGVEKTIRAAVDANAVSGNDTTSLLWDRLPWHSSLTTNGLDEGYHYATIFWSTVAGTLTMSGQPRVTGWTRG